MNSTSRKVTSSRSSPVPRTRSNISIASACTCSARAICSSLGTNIPASRTVRPCVLAATIRRRNSVYALPRLGVGGQGPPDLGEVDLLPVAAQGTQQVFLARVPVIEGADADPGPLGHGSKDAAQRAGLRAGGEAPPWRVT